MKQKEIIRYINKYAKTGIIDDSLIPLYDQNGKWCGDTIRWKHPMSHSFLGRMNKSFLPSSRRIFRKRQGTVLKTSFVWWGSDAVMVNYCEIHGSLIVTGNAPIHAPSLRLIGGNFISNTTKKVDLPWLSKVGGHFELLQTFLLSAPRLRCVGGNMVIVGMHPPLLETVGGRLGAYWAFSFEASNLREIGGCLVLSKADDIQVPVLESVGGSILLSHLARTIMAPKLRSVGGDFLADSVCTIRVPCLRLVAGDFDTSSAKGFYHPSIRVGGDWTMFPGAVREWEFREAARKAMRCEPIYL